MNTSRHRYATSIVVVGLICAAIFLAGPASGNGGPSELNQTWPSRTPTPGGPGPTQNPPATQTTSAQTPQTPQTPPPPGLTPGAGQETPEIGSSLSPVPAMVEPVSTSSVDESVPVRIPPAAEIGDCGFPPLILAFGPVAARSGPGSEYEIIANLAHQDERPIIGRAPTAPWWLIQLSPETQAWVSDLAVTVAGYTGAVAVVADDEEINGDQPLWNPTPNPRCTPPAQETLDAGSALLAATAPIDEASVNPQLEAQPSPASVENAASDDRSPGFSLLEPDERSIGSNLIWLPVIGVFLILAGGITFVVQRRQQ